MHVDHCPPRRATWLASLTFAALLSACGGGGGDDEVSSVPAGGPSTGTEGTQAGTDGAPALEPQGITPAAATPRLTLRVRADLAGGVGPVVQVRVNGRVVASFEVKSSSWVEQVVDAPGLAAGSKVDVAFTNDAQVQGQDRNLYLAWLSSGATVWLPSASGNRLDRGSGAAAFDGVDTLAGQGEFYSNAALRLTWPSPAAAVNTAARRNAARLLLQASFGPTPAELDRAAAMTAAAWVDEQLAKPVSAAHVSYVQGKYSRGAAFRPGGASYTPAWVPQSFWKATASGADPLRQRVAFALHQIFMVSQADSNLWGHARAYARYVDVLNQQAFGNFRTLMEEMALSPVMATYLSHLRNRPEDPASGRMPDENFARELMQLFTIGLHELNIDGTPRRGADGQPIETYGNADVMALAKVFTGWSWGFPDHQLTENNFRWGSPDFTPSGDIRTDLQRLKAYPGQHSVAEKRLFAGKPWAVSIPANGSAAADLKLALDALFHHPNVGPFIGRQLIQKLVTSAPSPGYVARVAAVFNNNGRGVRGDMEAVVRAILLDAEARAANPPASFGKLREPVLRVGQWMRAFGATSVSGEFQMAWEGDNVSQRAFAAPSVFGYFRPGHVPPGTAFSAVGATAPEFQIVNESTTAAWANTALAMSAWGLGWNGSTQDVKSGYGPLAALIARGNLSVVVDHLDSLLLAGRMSPTLRQALLDGMGSVNGSDAASHVNRARIAALLVMSSPEVLVQR